MAEQEVVKHTKKVYKVWNSKEHGFWHKLKEFFIEIFIIVFAISLSIWFHNRSEHAHQQKEAKSFLIGLKKDLLQDIREMNADKKSYINQQKTFSYITSVKMNDSLQTDSLKYYHTWIFNTTSLNPNNGRFEGFKSSGKISSIENEILQNDIMDLYQEDIPSLLMGTNAYIAQKNKLLNYIWANKKRLTDSTNNFRAVLQTDEAQNLASFLRSTTEITERYDICILKMEKIIGLVNSEYDLKDN